MTGQSRCAWTSGTTPSGSHSANGSSLSRVIDEVVCESVSAVAIVKQTNHAHATLPNPFEPVLSWTCFHRRGAISCEFSVNGGNGVLRAPAHGAEGVYSTPVSPADEMPYSSASTSASHEASMMFSETPTVPQLCSPSPDSMSTRVIAAVPFFSSSTRTL